MTQDKVKEMRQKTIQYWRDMGYQQGLEEAQLPGFMIGAGTGMVLGTALGLIGVSLGFIY